MDKITSLQARIAELRKTRKYSPVTVREFFATMPEGDFYFEADTADDWHPYYCEDCETWHRIAYAVNIGRTKGKHKVELMSCDEDGDWDYVAGYDESQGSLPGEFSEFYAEIYDLQEDFFLSWAEYWLDCAETGEDPLQEAYEKITFEFCVKTAEEFLSYIDK